MTDSVQHNAEIWSSRLEKELSTLTSSESNLPDFIKVKDHEMDADAGLCKVHFIVQLDTTTATTSDADDAVVEDIVVLIDASLQKQADGTTVDSTVPAYPFSIPKVKLVSGASRFPSPASTITNDSFVALDCDWTPSLHLTDAVLNIGLKIKESIMQSEPFHPSNDQTSQQAAADDIISKGARRFGSFFSSTKSTKNLPSNKSKKSKKNQPIKKSKATASNINIGDEINLLEAPWVDCQGLYSCKAIRRPTFVEDAIALAQAQEKPDQVSLCLYCDTAVNARRDEPTFLSDPLFKKTSGNRNNGRHATLLHSVSQECVRRVLLDDYRDQHY